MTGPEANQHYDLWVDRCREQLARGAAGDTLAAWMQSEGMSAEMAASVVQAAGGNPSVGFGRPGHQESVVPAPSSMQAPGAAAMGGAFGRPGAMAGDVSLSAAATRGHPGPAHDIEPTPVATSPAPTLPLRTAVTPEPVAPVPDDTAAGPPFPDVPSAVSEPAPAFPTAEPPPPSTLFGTPRPPVTFSPVRPPPEDPSQGQGRQYPPSPEEKEAESEDGGESSTETGARRNGAAGDAPDDSRNADAVEFEPEGGAYPGLRRQDDEPLDAVRDHDTGRLEEPAGDDPHPDSADTEQADSLESGSFANGDTVPDHADETVDETAAHDTRGEEREALARGDGVPAQLHDESSAQELQDDPGSPAGHADETAPEMASASDLEPHEADDPPAGAPARKSGFGRRTSSGTTDPITGGEDESSSETGDPDGTDQDGAAAGDGESESMRPAGDFEPEADPGADTPPHHSGPATDEELTAAAQELGISFRDDKRKSPHLQLSEEDEEIERAARKLGIRFREDPDAPAHADADDPTAKAARNMGISFRDLDLPKAKPQSTLRRYWPIILVMGLAAIAMPVAAVVMLFYWG